MGERVDGKGWSAARRALFLAGLAASGNVRMAIAPLGVTARAAYAKRQSDAGFAAEWAAAMAAAAEALGGPSPRSACGRVAGIGSDRPPDNPRPCGAWSTRCSPEAEREGKVVRRNCKGVMQLRTPRGNEWTAGREGEFFSALAATANVSASARHAGIGARACYVRRAQFPAFGEQWVAALEEGEAYLQSKLIAHATDLLEPPAAIDREGAAAALPAPDPAIGMSLLAHLARRKAGTQRRTGKQAAEPSMEAVRSRHRRATGGHG